MMNKNMRTLCALVAGALLAGCGGHGSSVLPQPKGSTTPSHTNASAQLTVIIPAPPKTTTARHAQYISASTQSIQFWENANDGNWQDQASGYANVTPGSPGCATDSSGNTTCTLTFPALGASNATYWVKAYDGPNGNGTLLGAASAQAAFSYGQDNKFSITLDGVASKYVVALAKTTLAAGTAADDAITVSAYDPDGNLIVNSPQLADSSGAPNYSGPAISATNVDKTDMILQGDTTYPFTGLLVHYNGGMAQDPTFTVTDQYSTPSNTATLHVGPPTNSASLIYAGGNSSGGAGYAYGWPGGSDGSNLFTADYLRYPSDSCSTSANFWALTTDAQNHLAYAVSGPCGYEDIVAQSPGGQIAWSITGINTAGTSTTLPDTTVALGFDSSNNIYNYEDSGPTCSTCTATYGEVSVLKAGSNGAFSTSMDLRAIDCVNNPEAMAVAPDGTVYAAHVGDNNTALEAIDVFAPGTSGYYGCTGSPAVTTSRYIGGSNSGLDKVTQLALDSSGNVYAANEYANSITVYGPAANGNVAPDRTIAGADTGISSPRGVAIDQFGNIYVLNAASGTTDGTITVYAANASGDAKPVRTISPSLYDLNSNIALIK